MSASPSLRPCSLVLRVVVRRVTFYFSLGVGGFWCVAGCQPQLSRDAPTSVGSTSASFESVRTVSKALSSVASGEVTSSAPTSSSSTGDSAQPTERAAAVGASSATAKGSRPSYAVSPASAPASSNARARPAAALVSGTVIAGEGYRAYLQGPSPIVVGRETVLTVHLEPQAPFKSNDKYPYRFAVSGAEGVNAPASAITGASITPTRTTLRVPVTATRAGRGSVSGTFSFSVCTPEKCLVEREPLVLGFEVVTDALSAGPNP